MPSVFFMHGLHIYRTTDPPSMLRNKRVAISPALQRSLCIFERLAPVICRLGRSWRCSKTAIQQGNSVPLRSHMLKGLGGAGKGWLVFPLSAVQRGRVVTRSRCSVGCKAASSCQVAASALPRKLGKFVPGCASTRSSAGLA